jgi:thiosulfate reductase cytochrome b subunit
MASIDVPPSTSRVRGPLIYRQRLLTRLTHWIWAICFFFLLLSGLQIFNAHPSLYVGAETGFEYDNSILSIGAEETREGLRGHTEILGVKLDTTGLLGVSDDEARAFPAWATIPSNQDLSSGRIVHFFFAWLLLATLLLWALASLLNGHVRQLIPTPDDIRDIPRDVADHARGRFHHGRNYSILQKLAYASVLFVLFPLIVLTGLTMSPAMNAALPWLIDLFGGRQTARTIHFIAMALLVGFFVIHMAMVLLAGPLNELRSMVTGWYRADPDVEPSKGDRT